MRAFVVGTVLACGVFIAILAWDWGTRASKPAPSRSQSAIADCSAALGDEYLTGFKGANSAVQFGIVTADGTDRYTVRWPSLREDLWCKVEAGNVTDASWREGKKR